MGHPVLGPLNAFIWCVIFMVVAVVCAFLYAAVKWICSENDEENNDRRNGATTYASRETEANQSPTQYEHIPLRSMTNNSGSPTNNYSLDQTDFAPAYPTSQAPYPTSQPPYPTTYSMPMPQP